VTRPPGRRLQQGAVTTNDRNRSTHATEQAPRRRAPLSNVLALMLSALGAGLIAHLDRFATGDILFATSAPSDAPFSALTNAPEPTRSQYLHWLSDDVAADTERARNAGCRVAERTEAGPVVLAVGRQLPGGVSGFATGGTVRTPEHLREVVGAYVEALDRCGRGTWTVAVTTSNHRLDDVELAGAHGRSWAATVAAIASTRDVTVVAGIDMEPSWGTFAAAVRWVADYRAADGPPLLFNASADGCPLHGDTGPCNNGWSVDAMASTIWSRAGDRALPQIYRTDGAMASQWGVIARAATRLGLEPTFSAAMSQRRACAQTEQRNCLDLPPKQAWVQLQQALDGVAVVPGVTDIGWG